MATLDSINLGLNTRWTNEFESSAIDREVKYTEDGRQYVFQKKKRKFRKIIFDCTGEWLTYATALQLAEMRDTGQPCILTHNDGRVFNVLLESIEGMPHKNFNYFVANSKFKLILHFIEI